MIFGSREAKWIILQSCVWSFDKCMCCFTAVGWLECAVLHIMPVSSNWHYVYRHPAQTQPPVVVIKVSLCRQGLALSQLIWAVVLVISIDSDFSLCLSASCSDRERVIKLYLSVSVDRAWALFVNLTPPNETKWDRARGPCNHTFFRGVSNWQCVFRQGRCRIPYYVIWQWDDDLSMGGMTSQHPWKTSVITSQQLTVDVFSGRGAAPMTCSPDPTCRRGRRDPCPKPSSQSPVIRDFGSGEHGVFRRGFEL